MDRSNTDRKPTYQDDDKIFYSGHNEDLIKTLLTKVRGWKTPSSLNVNDGIPPNIKQECMRDRYISAAVSYAWAAESYIRLKDLSKANDMATKVLDQVLQALALCSNAATIDNGKCPSEDIIPCSEKGLYVGNASVVERNSSSLTDTKSSKDYTGAAYLFVDGIGLPPEEDKEGTAQALGVMLEAIDNSGLMANRENKLKEKEYERSKVIDAVNKQYEKKYGISLEQFVNAIKKDDIKLVEQALQHGFPLDAPILFNVETYRNPLQYSAQLGKTEFIKLFVRYGIDINETGIEFKHRQDNIDKEMELYTGPKFNKLIRIRANIDDDYKWTALHYAVFANKKESVALLISLGADKTIKASCPNIRQGEYDMKFNFTPYQMAKKLGYFEIADLLK